MIKEDYVSFEVAKLLKEKGFAEKTFTYFDNELLCNGGWFEWNNSPMGQISAPTLQMAMKWLREVHKIFIEVYADKAYNAKDIIFNPEVWDKNLNSIWRAGCFTTYEQACEVAIKYCLENLI